MKNNEIEKEKIIEAFVSKILSIYYFNKEYYDKVEETEKKYDNHELIKIFKSEQNINMKNEINNSFENIKKILNKQNIEIFFKKQNKELKDVKFDEGIYSTSKIDIIYDKNNNIKENMNNIDVENVSKNDLQKFVDEQIVSLKEKKLLSYLLEICGDKILDAQFIDEILENSKKKIYDIMNQEKPYLFSEKLQALKQTENLEKIVDDKTKSIDFLKNMNIEGLNFLKQEKFEPNTVLGFKSKFEFSEQILNIEKKINNIKDFYYDNVFDGEDNIKKNEEKFSVKYKDYIAIIKDIKNLLKQNEYSKHDKNIDKLIEELEKKENFFNFNNNCYKFDEIIDEIKKIDLSNKLEKLEVIIKQLTDKSKIIEYLKSEYNKEIEGIDLNKFDIKIVDNSGVKYEESNLNDLQWFLQQKYLIVIYNGTFKPNTIFKPKSGALSQNIFITDEEGKIWQMPFDDVYGTHHAKKQISPINFPSSDTRYYYNYYKDTLDDDFKSKFLIEENVMQNSDNEFERVPYKFYCAGGEVFICRYAVGSCHLEGYQNEYVNVAYYIDKDFEESKDVLKSAKIEQSLEYVNNDIEKAKKKEKLLKQNLCSKEAFIKMWKIAEKIAKKFPTVRVDLFCVKQKDHSEKISFNELEDNVGSNERVFKHDLKPEAIKRYKSMISFAHIDEEEIKDKYKLLKKIDFKTERRPCKEVSISVKSIDKNKNIQNNK